MIPACGETTSASSAGSHSGLFGSLASGIIRQRRLRPCREREGELVLLTTDVSEADVCGQEEELSFALGRAVRLVSSSDESKAAGVADDALTGQPNLDGTVSEVGRVDSEIAARLNMILVDAVRHRASDVHFEPFEHQFKIRYRIDGVLLDMASPSAAAGAALHSRIKVLAGLDIAERRVAQDGRFRLPIDGREVDFRVSTLPTLFGESVVLRILDAKAIQLDLEQLGLPADVLAAIRRILRQPHGIFIVTGPTGSGKTTTLYSCLRELNAIDTKILTAEDPVEYELDGIIQVGMNAAAGLGFAPALRAFLRQDPDVIMVGEIRDLETAQIAIQAALTGHLVLTTLHTNDAAGAVTRLLDMGVEPYLLGATLAGVLAQRLVRRCCPVCARSGATARSTCASCGGSGFRGRVGVYELLMVNEDLRERITRIEPVDQIREAARRNGLRLLAEDAQRVVEAGFTTEEEVKKNL
jgi:type IV pilus assembly protein PilB